MSPKCSLPKINFEQNHTFLIAKQREINAVNIHFYNNVIRFQKPL